MLPGFWISRYRVTHRQITLDGAQILLLEPRKNLKMFSESHYFHFQYFSCAKPQSKKTQIDWKTPSGVFGSPLSVTKQKAPMRAFFCFQSGITGLISSVSFETTSTSIITAASIKFILVKKKNLRVLYSESRLMNSLMKNWFQTPKVMRCHISCCISRDSSKF